MEAIGERACGLDVHQRTVVACVLRGSATRRPQKEVRTFGTTTPELLALRVWLEACAPGWDFHAPRVTRRVMGRYQAETSP
jgi:hypothetical protein